MTITIIETDIPDQNGYVTVNEALRLKAAEIDQTFNEIIEANYPSGVGKYPIMGRDGETIIGMRLGGPEPAENGSICFIAGVHSNELLIGGEAHRIALEEWDDPNSPLKQAVLDKGVDIYLISAAQKDVVQDFFHLLENEQFHIDKFTALRERRGKTDGSRANGNRVRDDLKPEEINEADLELVNDLQYLEETVFSKCGAVFDIHSMSQPAKPVYLPHPKKNFPRLTKQVQSVKDAINRRIFRIAKKHQPYAEQMADDTIDMFPHLSQGEQGQNFTGFEGGGTVRALFEGGGPHWNLGVIHKGGVAAKRALGVFLGIEKFLSETPAKINLYEECISFYLPHSRNVDKMPPEAIFVNEADKDAEWHLITDNSMPQAVRNTLKERGFQTSYEPGRLGNGKLIQPGEALAYALDEEGKVSIIGLPKNAEAAVATMFPASGKNLPGDREESIGVTAVGGRIFDRNVRTGRIPYPGGFSFLSVAR